MTNQEFDALAERILLATLQSGTVPASEEIAAYAVETASAFLVRLNQRREQQRVETELTPEEIRFIETRAAIHAIKSVRERTGLSLKEAKALVDRERAKLGLD